MSHYALISPREYFFSAQGKGGKGSEIRELHGDLSAGSSDTRGVGVISKH